MTNSFRKKLKSSAGASITFALLLFLVCAVVGSVVLAAGTAASGRFSKLAEMDRRRASVNSAAELIVGLIDGKCVTKVTETTSEYTETVTYNSDGTETRSTGPSSPVGSTTTESGDTFFLLRSTAAGIGTASTSTLDLTHIPESGSAVVADALTVKADVTVDDKGSMTVVVYNCEGEKYSVRMSFDAKSSESTSSSVTEGTPLIDGNPSTKPYNVSVKKTEKVTTTVSVEWTLVGSEKVVTD